MRIKKAIEYFDGYGSPYVKVADKDWLNEKI